jgi:hypothetical protein
MGPEFDAEVEGGVWTCGRHVRGRGYEGDCEKYSEAALRGWCVLEHRKTLHWGGGRPLTDGAGLAQDGGWPTLGWMSRK